MRKLSSNVSQAPSRRPRRSAWVLVAVYARQLVMELGGRVPARPKLPVDDELLKLLIDAYDASKRDEKGYVNLSAMGQLAANRSSFDVRNYGYKRLSDLIESVANFKLERREGGQSYVKRVR